MTDTQKVRTAEIGIENCVYSFDMLFSYIVPEEMQQMIEPGMRVLVPFGTGNVLRQGMVFGLRDRPYADCEKLKTIHSLIDATALLKKELLELALWMRDRYFCPYFSCAKAVLPGGMCLKTEKLYSLCSDIPPERSAALNESERAVFAFLSKKKVPVRESVLLKKTTADGSSLILKKMVKKGILLETGDAFSRVNDLSVQTLMLSECFDAENGFDALTEKQRAAAELLADGSEMTVKELCYYAGVSDAVVKKLLSAGILRTCTRTVSRSPVENAGESTFRKVVLSEKQSAVYQSLLEAYRRKEEKPVLLHGITGSGKTNVYLELIDRVLEDGRNVIVLVPEISLTPQTFSLFTARYGKQTAVLHSALSIGERHDEWKRINEGRARVVIGTRSAVFAPLDNIGLIVIDEEQEHTYKSENAPRYSAKEAARFRCAYHSAMLLLVSATPSVETYAKADAGRLLLTKLDERYGNAVLPEVKIIDISDKTQIAPFMSISEPLAEEIGLNLAAGEQTILLVNRRGYNTFVVCPDCKEVLSCPRCSISLTYHQANNRLMCHYCGYSAAYTEKCPECGAENIRYSGSGTQRVEQELQMRFPGARVLRMDADTTMGKNSHDRILSAFGSGDYDILIGTQMVAKGLDFPNVTLVGILSADKELYNNDFRCSERTFDLLTQVVGRAGRGNRRGRAVIQTLTPENGTIRVASKQDYIRFFQGEISLRRAMVYPPFCDICEIAFSGPDREKTEQCSEKLLEILKKKNEEEFSDLKLIILGPLSPRVPKVNNTYRQRLIIKCRNTQRLREFIAQGLKEISADRAFRSIRVYADMNPENLN